MTTDSSIEVPTELDVAVDNFLRHLTNWLVVQPEWPVLMGTTTREYRREMARELARYITTIPTSDSQPYVPNRVLRRKLVKALRAGGVQL